MKTFMAGVVDFDIGVLHNHFVIAAVLELFAHMLGIFVEFGSVVGLSEQTFKENRVRDPKGRRFFIAWIRVRL